LHLLVSSTVFIFYKRRQPQQHLLWDPLPALPACGETVSLFSPVCRLSLRHYGLRQSLKPG
ncbi:MAG TPA: hypothetical protein PL112_25830, partial [Candidatus Obscuribacter sp.]|nr:hypothetical protein [Candidatus Obscuribacter sp.]